jgi:hypothetical protein
MVCADPTLSRLDEVLAAAYRDARAGSRNPEHVRVEQLAWLSDERNRCSSVACLSAAYGNRIGVLSGRLRHVRIVGNVDAGTDFAGIYADGGEDVGFSRGSPAWEYIFNVCKVDDRCEVVGYVHAENEFNVLSSVSWARRVGGEAVPAPENRAVTAPIAYDASDALTERKADSGKSQSVGIGDRLRQLGDAIGQAIDRAALPSCDTDEAFDEVSRTVDESPVGRLLGLSIIRIRNAEEVFISDSARVCKGTALLNTSESYPITYSFTIDGEDILIEVLGLDVVD